MSPTLCPFPFMSVDVSANGTFGICCDAEPTGVSVGDTPYEEWFHGTHLQDIRRMMLDGQAPLACKRCFKNETQGLTSFRQSAMKDFAPENYGDFYSMPQLIHLNYRFGNKCNLACLMCHESSSTAVGAEKKRHGEGDYQEIHNPASLSQSSLKNIRSLYIGGGEPSLAPEPLALLERLREAGNDQVEIWVNSNATSPRAPFFQKLKEFKKVILRFSIDGTGPAYELLRYPMKWPRLQTCIEEFFQLYPSFDFGVIFTLNVLNVANAPEFVRWWVQNSGPGRFRVLQTNDLVFPEFMSAALVDDTTKEMALRELAAMPEEPARELLAKLNELKVPADRERRVSELKNYVEKRERWRGITA